MVVLGLRLGRAPRNLARSARGLRIGSREATVRRGGRRVCLDEVRRFRGGRWLVMRKMRLLIGVRLGGSCIGHATYDQSMDYIWDSYFTYRFLFASR